MTYIHIYMYIQIICAHDMHWWWSFLNLSIILFDNKNALQYTYFTMRICTYIVMRLLFYFNIMLPYCTWIVGIPTFIIYIYASQLGLFGYSFVYCGASDCFFFFLWRKIIRDALPTSFKIH